MDIIDRNLMAALAILHEHEGIGKSKLYSTERGRRMVDWLLASGLAEQKGYGCYLTEEGEAFRGACAGIARTAGQEEDIDRLIISIKDRYDKRLDLIKRRK